MGNKKKILNHNLILIQVCLVKFKCGMKVNHFWKSLKKRNSMKEQLLGILKDYLK